MMTMPKFVEIYDVALDRYESRADDICNQPDLPAVDDNAKCFLG
jgi:hypothetical protein